MKRSIAVFVVALLSTPVLAQNSPRYLILFKDKTNSTFSADKPKEFLSERSIQRRAKQNIPITIADLPVNTTYLTAIKETGAKIIYPTKWFNGALVEASDSQLTVIKKLPFYKGIERNLPLANIGTPSAGIYRMEGIESKLGTQDEVDYGRMNNQLALMETSALHAKGFHGENMLIAVFDNGFPNGNNVNFLQNAKDEKRIVDTYDFVERDGNVYNNGTQEHGLRVLSTMAAYIPATMVGVSYKASYVLYRTENDEGESPYEEVTWLMAAERADSTGVDVINSSLGYRTFDGQFNTTEYNYKASELDGKTTIISKAARLATRTGMLVVNASGNDGSLGLSAPADVDSVLTVGGTLYDRSHNSSSSVGPNALGQLKPDVSAVGAGTVIGTGSGTVVSGSGTSFASPLIAGLAAILWQAYPNLTAQQIAYVLKKSGNQASNPDNLVGYGVPNARVAIEIIQNEFKPLSVEKEDIQQIILTPNPVDDELVLIVPSSLIGQKAILNFYRIDGKLISKNVKLLAAKTEMSINGLSFGNYILNIQVASRERSILFFKK